MNPAKDRQSEQPVVVFLRGDHTVNETKLLIGFARAHLSSNARR